HVLDVAELLAVFLELVVDFLARSLDLLDLIVGELQLFLHLLDVQERGGGDSGARAEAARSRLGRGRAGEQRGDREDQDRRGDATHERTLPKKIGPLTRTMITSKSSRGFTEGLLYEISCRSVPSHARMPRTTSPCTSVRRMSRPPKRWVSFLWSMP